MMVASVDVSEGVQAVLETHDPATPGDTADALRGLWLQFEPRSVAGIKAEQRDEQETIGIPVEVLRSIGKEVGKVVRKQVDDFVPLACLLWDDCGREGRVAAVYVLGSMELAEPGRILPLLKDLCRSCVTWEVVAA